MGRELVELLEYAVRPPGLDVDPTQLADKLNTLVSGHPPAPSRGAGKFDGVSVSLGLGRCCHAILIRCCRGGWVIRSEEHTSELQYLMRISYAVFCLKKNTR